MVWDKHLLRRRAAVSLALASMLVALVACAPAATPQPTSPAQPSKPAAQAPVELRIGSSFPKGDIHTEGQDKFAELVNQKSNGQISAKVFYESLGAEQQLAQAVMEGSVDVGIISNGNAGRFTKAFYIYDLPFLFKSNENMLKSKAGPTGRELVAKFEKDLGVKALLETSAGAGRDIQTTKKLVKAPADIKGVKIRTVSTPVDLGVFKAWGANPTPIDWAQVVTSLHQGVIEGMAVAPSFLLTSKSYEAVKYNTRIGYQYLFEQVFMNSKKFESLSPEHQKIVIDAGKEAGEYQHEWVAKRVDSDLKELAKLGVTIYEPTPTEYEEWASIREKVWEEVAAQQAGNFDLSLAKQIYQSQ